MLGPDFPDDTISIQNLILPIQRVTIRSPPLIKPNKTEVAMKATSIVLVLVCGAMAFAGCDNDNGQSSTASSNPLSPAANYEFSNYDYEQILEDYPEIRECAADDYAQASVEDTINESIDSGDLAEAAPAGGFTHNDKEALYREYMLPCKPNLDNYVPENVQTIQKVLSEEVWEKFASKTANGDSSKRYENSQGDVVPWPMQDNFVSNAYENFLTAAARYPYFCGEQGFYDSVDEACKREIASFLAHAAQETGNGSVEDSFWWLREYGYTESSEDASFFDQGCSEPFICKHDFQRYYGRGPKQLTYYYNYAGFSASYFGNYQFLLDWPDMVAYDGELYYSAAIWFVMTHQPPKPSIHDIMIGRYSPAETCTETSSCNGLVYDSTSGVKYNFGVTIEVVNGGVECRLLADGKVKNQTQSHNRCNAYISALEMLNANLTEDEKNLKKGCDFIADETPDGTAGIFGVNASLNKGLNTWLDMSGTTCQAQSWGGSAMISVTSEGIIDACLRK